MGCAASVDSGKAPTPSKKDVMPPKPLISVSANKEASTDQASRESSSKGSRAASGDGTPKDPLLNTKSMSPFQKSMSFTLGMLGGVPATSILPPPKLGGQDTSVSAKLDDGAETLVSLFGDLYKVKQSNGSLECVCPDNKKTIFLVTPMDDEPDFSTKMRKNMSAEPEELSDTEDSIVRRSVTSRQSQTSPVPSIDVSKTENVAQVGFLVSNTSIKDPPRIYSEKGSLMSSQKASLYQDSPKHSRTGSTSLSRNNPLQAQAVIAAMEAGNARRATLKKDNTFSGQPSNNLDMAPRTSLRKATTVHQATNIAMQKSKRAVELEEEYDNWAEANGVEPSNECKKSNESGGAFKLTEGVLEEQSFGSEPKLHADMTVKPEQTV